MELAASIAQYEEGECHVIHAWDFIGDSMMKSRLRPEEYEDLVKSPEFKDWKNGQYKIISFFAK